VQLVELGQGLLSLGVDVGGQVVEVYAALALLACFQVGDDQLDGAVGQLAPEVLDGQVAEIVSPYFFQGDDGAAGSGGKRDGKGRSWQGPHWVEGAAADLLGLLAQARLDQPFRRPVDTGQALLQADLLEYVALFVAVGEGGFRHG